MSDDSVIDDENTAAPAEDPTEGSGIADAFDVGPSPASEAALDNLNSVCDEGAKLKSQIEGLEEALSAAKSSLHHLSTRVIPEAMAELGFGDDDYIVRGGWKIKISDVVSGGLPKNEEKRATAIEYIEEMEGADLIRNKIEISFPKEAHEDAVRTMKIAQALSLDANMSSSVHASSLAAFVRERLRNGEEVDSDRLGIYIGRGAKFTRVKT